MPHTAPADVVCLGESMVTFLPCRPGPLAEVPAFERAIGGAESNVACALAGAGHRTRWVSRVGADGFGDHLLSVIAAAGVDTSAVRRDPHRPTGIYFRTDGERPTSFTATGSVSEVAYYRAGSAASAMSPSSVDLDAANSGRVLHLTGITPALSPDCLALCRTLLAPRRDRPLLSFDVNYRAALWHSPAQAGVLLELARACDLVFVGEDEAAAWGVTGGPRAVRAALPEPATLVVKQGADGATAFVRDAPDPGNPPNPAAIPDAGGDPGQDTRLHVPAPRVDVVAAVGAGDAFAAGYLSAALRGLPLRDRLRHGHLLAAAALTVPGDLAEPPARALADQLAAAEPDTWGTLRLRPGWTTQKATAP